MLLLYDSYNRHSDKALWRKLVVREFKRYGQGHVDEKLIKPIGIPVIVVPTNYDTFATSMSIEKRNVVCWTLSIFSCLSDFEGT